MTGQESCCHITHHRLQLTPLYETPLLLNVFLTTLSRGMSHWPRHFILCPGLSPDTSYCVLVSLQILHIVPWPLPVLLASVSPLSQLAFLTCFQNSKLFSLFYSETINPLIAPPHQLPNSSPGPPVHNQHQPSCLTEQRGHPFSSLIECILLRTQVGD